MRLADDQRGSAAAELLIRDVRVFDGTRVVAADSVVVRGGLVAQVGVGLQAGSAARVVDGLGATLLPGLIDSHVDAMRAANLTQALAFGVTTDWTCSACRRTCSSCAGWPPPAWMWPISAAPGSA